MLGRVKVDFEYVSLIANKDKFKCLDINFSDFYELVEYLIDNKYFIVCEDTIMYAEEMRFDYLNKEVYIPYIKSDYTDIDESYHSSFDRCGATNKYNGHKIGYNNRIDKYKILDKKEYVIDDLYLINQGSEKVILEKVSLGGLPLRHTDNTNRDAKDLFMRYIRYSYGILDEKDTDKFYSTKKSNITNTEKRILKELNLEYYGEYKDIEYADVRGYKIESLLGEFTDAELQVADNFNVRRFRFECELYTRCMARDLWVGWTKGSSEMILNNSQYFNKYKYNEFSLIFKSRWLL